MSIEHRRFDSALELGRAAARMIVGELEYRAGAESKYLLGCPGGRTPKPIYEALGVLCDALDVDRSRIVIVMMDDYVDASTDPPTHVPVSAHYSCRRFAEHEIRRVINGNATESKSIPPESVWTPDPGDPEEYDERIAAAGGVDLFIVASGASDGHVAFCGPGSSLDGKTSIVELAPSTRIDNMVTFPAFESADEVPTKGVSVGLGTIRELSSSILMVLHGEDKASSLARILGADQFDPMWPATFVVETERAMIWSDAAAARSRTERHRHDRR